MRLLAQAPGKLVLLGEYAVLEGAPALALAVDRHVNVTLDTDRPVNCDLVLCAPELGVQAACGDVDAAGRLCWRAPTDVARRLQLVTQIWNTLAAPAWPRRTGVRLQIDNPGFFDRGAQGRCKLGLGSSAALTVALAAALMAAREAAGATDAPAARAAPGPHPDLTQLILLHRQWQHEQGSGVDIAASLSGGLIRYRRPWQQAPAQVRPVQWPPAGASCAFIWSGETVSTTHALSHLAQWRMECPSRYQTYMAELCMLAGTLPAALTGGTAAFVRFVADYTAALRRFARASGLTILTARQERLRQLAAREGISYKPCGAGGDIGVAIADEPERLQRLQPHLARLASRVLPLSMASAGLQVRKFPEAPARSHVGY